MLTKLFPRLRVCSLSEQVRSRDAFAYLDRGMQVCGWIRPRAKSRRPAYALWSTLYTVLAIVLLPAALLVSYIKDLSSFTAGQFLTSLQVGINCFGSSIKASYTFAGVKRFQAAKQLLDRMDRRCQTAGQRAQLHLWVARCNQCYMCYQVMYSFYAASTFLAGAYSGRLPWKLYNPLIDWEASNRNFWLASTCEYFWMSAAVLQDQMADVYPIIYFLILRMHISLLKERLKCLRSDPHESEDNNYRELISCIEDHRLILE